MKLLKIRIRKKE